MAILAYSSAIPTAEEDSGVIDLPPWPENPQRAPNTQERIEPPMRLSVFLVAAALLAAGIAGCGGGIETGVPAQPGEMDSVQKEQMKEMSKTMLKGPESFSGKK